MTEREPTIPGTLRLAWMFFMQPLRLHALLKAAGVDPGAHAWHLWRSGRFRDRATRAWMARAALVLVGTNVTALISTELLTIASASTTVTSAALLAALGFAGGALVHVVAVGVTGGGGGALDTFGVAGSVMVGFSFGLAVVRPDTASGVPEGIALGVAGGVAGGVVLGVGLGVAGGVAALVGLAVPLGVVIGVVRGGGVAAGVACVASCVAVDRRLWSFWFEALSCLVLAQRISVEDHSRLRRLATWLPYRWHDLIYLPLPGLRRFLVEAGRRDPQFGAELVTEALSTVGQKRVARDALFELQCHALENAPERVEAFGECLRSPFLVSATEVSDATTQTNPIAAVLPQLSSLARDLVATQSNPLHAEARRSLTSAQAHLSRALDTASVAPRRERPQLDRVLRAWQRALESARGDLEARERASPQVGNPFRAGVLLERAADGNAHTVFKGREDLGRELAQDLSSGRREVVFVFGQRRMGKSSFLSHLQRWLGTRLHLVPINFQSLAGDETRMTPWNLVTRTVAASLKLPAPTPSPTFAASLTWLRDAETKLAPDHILLIAIDEVEKLREPGEAQDQARRDFLDFLRACGDALHRTRFVLFSAVTLERLGPDWQSRLISCLTRRVSYLSDAAAAELVEHPVPDFPDIYPAGGAAQIRHETNRQPYLIQLVCSNLCDGLLEPGPDGKPRRQASADDLRRALRKAITDNQVFGDLFADRSDAERTLLERLAAGPLPWATLTDRVERDAARTLLDEEILLRDHDSLRIAVPMFATWVRRRLDPFAL